MILAPIERLPIELLQQVFIESNHNTALPRASNYLGTRLSSDYVYHSACNYHLTEVHGKRAEQTTNQTYIFASRWMTWNFFKSWIIRRYEVNGCLCGLTPGEGCFDAQWPPNFEDATTMVFSRSHIPRIAFVKGRLPKKLLRAPWTQDKIEFLRFLLWITSMTVDWTDPETRQTTIEGRKQAMSEKNLAAVELFNHNRRLGKAADLETVRQAVVETGCDRSIVYDTLNAANTWNKSGLPRHSPQLHAWCEIQVAKGNPKGEWLRTKLEESSIWSSRATAESKLAESQMHVRVKTRPLNPKAGDYNGGPGDELVVHELEWNKAKTHRGWLILRSWGYTSQTVTHNLSWSQVMRESGPRMYCGPIRPRRLECWTEDELAARTIILWLAPPASKPLKLPAPPILERRVRVDGL